MKLFVWCNPYRVSYGSSMVVVVAETVDQARELAKTGKAFAYGTYEQDHPESRRVDLADKEPKTRVVDAPCAEWHEWSE